MEFFISPQRRKWYLLAPLQRCGDAALFVMRVIIGLFLVWGVLDNILSVERMREFAAFLAEAGFPAPGFMAPLSVWAQLLIGVAFMTGFLTRWAGLVCVINFVVAIVMVDAHGGIRAAFPSTGLVLIGLYLATYGPGKISIDHLLEGRSGNREI